MTSIPADEKKKRKRLNFNLFPNNFWNIRDFFSQAIIFPPSKIKILCEKAEKTGTRHKLEAALFQVQLKPHIPEKSKFPHL